MTSQHDPQQRRRYIGKNDVLWIAVPLLLGVAALGMLGYMFFLVSRSAPPPKARPGVKTSVPTQPGTKTSDASMAPLAR